MNEDWRSVIVGLVIILMSMGGLIYLPKITSWSTLSGLSFNINYIITFIYLIVIITLFTDKKILNRGFVAEIVILFLCSTGSLILGKNAFLNSFGLEYVIWSLFIGLAIGNLTSLRTKITGEVFCKVGLVLLGAEILFSTILTSGLAGLFQATVGLATVWTFCYLLSRKFGLGEEFSAIMATGASVCGLSAAIAAGGAVKGEQKDVSYVITIISLLIIPLIIMMPILAGYFGLSQNMAGAWIGGSIFNTGAVVASSSIYGNIAMQTASVLKMTKNAMIGIIAFTLSIWWVTGKKKGSEKPSPRVIWDRFPKFVLGFILVSLLFSFLLPQMGFNITTISASTKGMREWLFAMLYVGIGINTDIKSFVKIGGGKPLLVFMATAIFAIGISFITAVIFFRG